MFKRVSVPILGLVENMSGFVCAHCGEVTDIFGRGGGERYAAENGIDFLGGVPLDITVRQGADVGVPAVAQSQPGPGRRRPGAHRAGDRRQGQHPGRSGATGPDRLVNRQLGEFGEARREAAYQISELNALVEVPIRALS
jgi:hypothetical protein